MRSTRFTLLLFWALAPFALLAQNPEAPPRDTTRATYSFIAVPTIYYAPETDWGFGAAGVMAWHFPHTNRKTRPSNVQLATLYTLKDQIMVYIPFQVFFDNNDHVVYGELGYYRYSYFFYGVGNSARSADEEVYEVDYPRVRLNMLRRVGDSRLFLGARYWFDDYRIQHVRPGGLLDGNRVLGSGGGIVSSLGFLADYDSRDSYTYPTKGIYIESSAMLNGAWLGSAFNFSRLVLDYAQYFPLGKKEVFAVNAYVVGMSGEVPFNELAFIGGNRKMRGYIEGRYRDKALAMVQAEYRLHLFWRLGIVLFGGYGGVAPSWGEMRLADYRWTLGGGIRATALRAENINLRLDYGFGQGTGAFYLTIGEAF